MMQLEQRLAMLKERGIWPRDLRTIGQNYGALIALVLLILFNLFFTRQFSSIVSIADLLVHVTPTLILGVGMTLVIATGGADRGLELIWFSTCVPIRAARILFETSINGSIIFSALYM